MTRTEEKTPLAKQLELAHKDLRTYFKAKDHLFKVGKDSDTSPDVARHINRNAKELESMYVAALHKAQKLRAEIAVIKHMEDGGDVDALLEAAQRSKAGLAPIDCNPTSCG